MRILIIFFFLLLCFNCISQTVRLSNKENSDSLPAAGASKITFRCGATQNLGQKPLLIVDGIPLTFNKMSELNADQIECIEVLKDSKAAALFGRSAMNGVIIITTKNEKLREFVIRDLLEQRVLPGAIISFISTRNSKDSLLLLSNDNGFVATNKLKPGEEYRVSISSPSYQTLSTLYKTGQEIKTNFLLQRSIRREPPAGTEKAMSFIVYPNPVQAGRAITIEINSHQNKLVQVNLITVDGRLVLSQTNSIYNGENRLNAQIGLRWPTGIYFLQILDEKGNNINREKLFIQQ